MAMPTGNVEKMAGGVEMMGQYHHHPRQWVPDERDGFISWIRSEFAAANAIIDSMCSHLRSVGEAGEYDGVIGSLQQRRVNWYPVLHMQQYFSVSEVVHSLQQVAWRRERGLRDRDRGGYGYRGFEQKGGKRFGGGYRQGGHRGVEVSGQEGNVDYVKADEGKLGGVIVKTDDKDLSIKSQVENGSQDSGNSQAKPSAEGEGVNHGSTEVKLEKASSTSPFPHGRKDLSISAKTFVGTEIVDGKSVNAVDGLKLYEELLDSSEVANMVSLANELRTSGRKGFFQGPTFLTSHRPSRGHGRDIIQLGVPIVDSTFEDGATGGTFKDRRIEPIPGLMQDVIERLSALQVITVQPDCCIIDFFNEGDFSQPYLWSHRFGRPVCVLFLTECDMTFGKVIVPDHLGNYKGSINLSLTPGSMLVMQGRSSDFARHALPALQKQRILVTLTKSQPKKPSGGHYSSAMTQSHWAPPHNRSSNHIHNSLSPKHQAPVSTAGVLPAPPICMPIPPSNGVQPLFMPTAVTPVLPFPPPVALPPTSAGWTVGGPRHPPPRLPVPGTGVFLPPGSGDAVNHPSTNESLSTLAENETSTAKLNGDKSAATDINGSGKMDGKDCNGTADETNGIQPVGEEQQNVVKNVANEPAETVL
ncbi:RNA demethylase ALKBH10B isoform X2 [Apium graveolens]|uniref:RNA demethylase ALKBH10B isoform X2 n=1 Tax=Apium graveolens TaxID=4045 RepID=UPI003D7AB6B7